MAKKAIVENKYGKDYCLYVMTSKGAVTADIRLIQEYDCYGKKAARYRVDFRGYTKRSMVTLAEAKKIARAVLDPYR